MSSSFNVSFISCAVKLVGRGPPVKRMLFLLDLPSRSSHFSFSIFTWAFRELTVESSLDSSVPLSVHVRSSSWMVWSWAFSHCSIGSTVFSNSCFTKVISERRSKASESILLHKSPFMEASIHSSRSQSGKLASSFSERSELVVGEASS